MPSHDPQGALRWLDLLSEDGRAAYHGVWRESSFRRPHDHPGFLDMMQPSGYRAAAVVYQHSPLARIVYPFFCCRLNDFPAFRDIQDACMHMVSPYGYGGPLYEGPEAEKGEASLSFEELFNRELARRGFVSEFVREDVFAGRLADRSSGLLIEQQPNVAVRLQRPDEEIWRAYKPKVRKNVNRAKESQLRVEFDRTGRFLPDFVKVYHETMERTAASVYFMIPEEKFRALTNALGPEGGVMYVHVFDADTVVSTELLLLSSDSIYSLLGGTLSSAFMKRPNDLLKHEVIRWGKDNGFKWYVLGGGVSASDGIFQYKESFDPGSIMPFFVRRHVVNPDAYSMLVNRRRAYETEQGNDWTVRADFFPEYLA
jgi:hypothetical protein